MHHSVMSHGGAFNTVTINIHVCEYLDYWHFLLDTMLF